MYYIDAVESEMALFDFPGIAPATESSSEGVGSKVARVVKFIVKKIKEFVRKIIELIKYLLGARNKYKALDVKNQALKDFRVRIKSYLPDKEVTDLTKVKGLSSYQGGESGPYISIAQARNAEQAVDQSLEYVIKRYSDDLKIYNSDLADIRGIISQSAMTLAKYGKESQKSYNNNDTKNAVFEMTNAVNGVHEASQKSKGSKDDIISTRDDSKKKISEQLTEIVNGRTNGLPDVVLNLVKSVINRYAVSIKIALRDGDHTLSKHLKALEECANVMENLAKSYENVVGLMSQDDPWKKVTMDASKVLLDFSRDIFVAINTVKASSEGVIFEGVTA